MKKSKLNRVYKKLFNRFGKQEWWPAKTKLEVIVGAVLTQNTAWSNVEKAIKNLRKKELLSFHKLANTDTGKLARTIRPAGYFNLKARRLKNLLLFIRKHYKGKLGNIRKIKTKRLRDQLLSINGIGPETADSILLYAMDRSIFVVDSYTKRIFSRLGMIPSDLSYDEVQELFMKNLSPDVHIFNEYHALIVKLGKDYCKKSKPRCSECPLRDEHS